MDLRNLIKEQFKIVLSEQTLHNTIFNNNFWKWFGNSKVSENGTPLICYHGTKDASINKFDISKAGSNTDSGMWGKGFYFTSYKKYADTYNRNKDGGGRTFSVFLSIKNPLMINDKKDIPKINIPNKTIEDMRNAPFAYSNMFRDWLIENGHDGVIDSLSPTTKQYVALYPNQIKSIENDGSWDVNDNNIYS
jgi:hypothetical protein